MGTCDGCNGGNPDLSYNYLQSTGGLEPESDYPYVSGTSEQTGTCKVDKADFQVSISGYNSVSSAASTESNMVSQIQNSPISVCVDATTWQTYTSGIVGSSCGTSLDHCVQAVGVNTASDGTNYWIVRNSWATDWGVDGYIYVQEGINACGIATLATTANIK